MPGNLRGVPASALATWPTPNYDAPGRHWIVPYALVLQTITSAMVGTRLWLRATNQAGPLGLDDLLLVPGYLAATMFTALCIIQVEDYGVNRHLWDVPFHLYEPALLCAWLSELSFLISTSCTKVSVLLFFRRLTQGTVSKRWKYAIIGAIVFTVLYCIGFILAIVFTCMPTEAYWKAYSGSYTKNYSCANTTVLNPISGALSIFSDLYAILLPMSMLRHFDAPRRQKVALNIVFSLGLLVVVAAAVRTYYLYRLGKDWDITWIGYNEYVWGLLESQLSLICASAPALRVFFRRYMSDPMSRMVQSIGTVSNTNRNTQRDSSNSGFGRVNCTQNGRQISKGQEMEDRKLIMQHDTKALSTVEESARETPSPTSPTPTYVIKTPADYELFNLQNIERNRPPRATFLRMSSVADTPDVEAGLRASMNGPLTDWHATSAFDFKR